MSNHTKGPWHVQTLRNGNLVIVNQAGDIICRMTRWSTLAEEKATAELIAEAPSMFNLIIKGGG